MKAVKNTAEDYASLDNEDIVLTETVSDSTQVLYSFDFVGIVLAENHIFKVYPKYIDNTEHLFDRFKQVLRVIEKYNNRLILNKNLFSNVYYLNTEMDALKFFKT